MNLHISLFPSSHFYCNHNLPLKVHVASNFYNIEPTRSVKRWDKKNEMFINIQSPAMLHAYNNAMGGVDR